MTPPGPPRRGSPVNQTPPRSRPLCPSCDRAWSTYPPRSATTPAAAPTDILPRASKDMVGHLSGSPATPPSSRRERTDAEGTKEVFRVFGVSIRGIGSRPPNGGTCGGARSRLVSRKRNKMRVGAGVPPRGSPDASEDDPVARLPRPEGAASGDARGIYRATCVQPDQRRGANLPRRARLPHEPTQNEILRRG